jgi:hypothetical protein
MGLSNYGKLIMANSEFEKGLAFLGACYLLRHKALTEPQQYVALHLLAQGAELLMKGCLYGKDYITNRKKGRKIGHDLAVAYSECEKAFDLRPLRQHEVLQLQALSELFKSNTLRYSGLNDIFIAPSTIDTSLLERRIKCGVRLGRREFRKAFLAQESPATKVSKDQNVRK